MVGNLVYFVSASENSAGMQTYRWFDGFVLFAFGYGRMCRGPCEFGAVLFSCKGVKVR